MKFKLGCQLDYDISSNSTFIFNICLLENKYQTILEQSLIIEPNYEPDRFFDRDKHNSYFRLNAKSGKLKLDYQATVALTHDAAEIDKIEETIPAQLPLEFVPYLYPSRYCQSDRLIKLANDEFGDCQPGYSQVKAICDWIYHKIDYISGSSDSHTSAYDTATQRAGVCRDFAHLGIALCRALSIPARFVSAYAWQLDPPDFHACFEAYLGDLWYLFDATRLAPTNRLVRIGTGRDAADTAFATVFGAVQLNEMNVFIDSLDEQSEQPESEHKAYTNVSK